MNDNARQMLRRYCVSASLLIVLLCCQRVIAQESAKVASPLAKGTLSGTVVGPDGKPVANVRVWANNYGDKLLGEVRTNAEGRFRLGPVEPVYRHRFDLLFDADGFARQYVAGQTYSIFPGTDCDLGMIRLDRGRIYSGQVLDVDGKPRAGATVKCEVARHHLGHTIGYFGPAVELKTDADGHFRSQPMPVGSIYVTAHASERQFAYVIGKNKLPDGEESLAPIRLEKDVPIFGIVQDEKGKPVVGAKFHASGVSETTTDAEGKFTFRGFGPETRFQMQGTKDGHAFINWGVSVKKDGIRWFGVNGDDQTQHGPFKELTILMKSKPKAWIEGRAVDAITGKPVRIEKVVLCQLERKADGTVERRG